MSSSHRRPRCPFYGFHWPEQSRALSDTGGNECGLDFERNGPCAMEHQGREPDFDLCPVASPIKPLLEFGKESVRLYPADRGSDGVRLGDWTAEIMARVRRAP